MDPVNLKGEGKLALKFDEGQSVLISSALLGLAFLAAVTELAAVGSCKGDKK